jgi:sister chromatid cohesion protein PDS5
MISILSRASFRIINQSIVPTLIKRLQRNDARDGHLDGLSEQAERIFTLISKLCPLLYKPHIAELAKAVSDERNSRLVDACLQALASLARHDGKTSGHDK